MRKEAAPHGAASLLPANSLIPLTFLCLGKAIRWGHIMGMMRRRTLFRHALWALPLAAAIASCGPSSQAVAQTQTFAQSEQRQRDLDRQLEQRQRDRALDRQQDRNSADQQLQNQELQRQLLQQQNRDRQRNNTINNSNQNLNQRRGI